MSKKLSMARWQQLARRLNLVNATGTFLQLESKYSGRSRHFHDASHVNHCLAQLDSNARPEAAEPLVEFAIWCQDVIFSSMSARSEMRSADWADIVLRESRFDEADRQLVRSLILATAHRGAPVELRQQLVADIDLLPLGQGPAQFRLCEEQIRAEFGWVPRQLYRARRLEMLRTLMQRPQIYALEEFHHRYEVQARANVQWLLDQPHGSTSTFRWRKPF